MELENTQWLEKCVEECKDIFVESNFTERYARIEGYHGIGERILQEFNLADRKMTYGERIIATVAKSIKVSTRTVYNMVEFARMFPDLQLLPDNKTVSWTKVVKKYLPKAKESLPTLLSRDDMINVVKINAEFLVDNLTQKKTGISFWLPIAYVL